MRPSVHRRLPMLPAALAALTAGGPVAAAAVLCALGHRAAATGVLYGAGLAAAAYLIAHTAHSARRRGRRQTS